MHLLRWLRRKPPAPVKDVTERQGPDEDEPYASYEVRRPRSRWDEVPRTDRLTAWDMF